MENFEFKLFSQKAQELMKTPKQSMCRTHMRPHRRSVSQDEQQFDYSRVYENSQNCSIIESEHSYESEQSGVGQIAVPCNHSAESSVCPQEYFQVPSNDLRNIVSKLASLESEMTRPYSKKTKRHRKVKKSSQKSKFNNRSVLAINQSIDGVSNNSASGLSN